MGQQLVGNRISVLWPEHAAYMLGYVSQYAPKVTVLRARTASSACKCMCCRAFTVSCVVWATSAEKVWGDLCPDVAMSARRHPSHRVTLCFLT